MAWGDGRQDIATLTSDGNGHLIVTDSHVYADESDSLLPDNVTITVASGRSRP